MSFRSASFFVALHREHKGLIQTPGVSLLVGSHLSPFLGPALWPVKQTCSQKYDLNIPQIKEI